MGRRDPAPPMPTGGFGDLLRARGLSGSGKPVEEAPVVEEAAPVADLASLPKVVLRVQRKGHGGKTVTRVEGLSLSADVLGARAKALRKTLGTGVRVDGESFIVQGDQQDRVRAWLTEQGVRRIVA